MPNVGFLMTWLNFQLTSYWDMRAMNSHWEKNDFFWRVILLIGQAVSKGNSYWQDNYFIFGGWEVNDLKLVLGFYQD